MTKPRSWKTDRMLALKLAMPRAVVAIAQEPYGSHSFDHAVCDFFGLPRNINSFDSLRPTAKRLTGRSRIEIGDWYSMADQLRAIMESNDETV